MLPYEVDERREGQNGQQSKSSREKLSSPRLQMKWSQVQAADRQKRQREKQQQRCVKITLRLIGGARREAPLPNRAPRQRDGQHHGEALSQRASRHEKIKMWLLQEKGNSMIGQMKTRGIKKQQHRPLPPLYSEHPPRLGIFQMKMQHQGRQHVQSGRNDGNRKLIEPHGRLQVMNLRVQGQQGSGIEKE